MACHLRPVSWTTSYPGRPAQKRPLVGEQAAQVENGGERKAMPMLAPAGRRRPVIADEPALADIGTAVCIIPTDAPEADRTLARNGTALAPVAVRAGSEPGIDWPHAAAPVRR